MKLVLNPITEIFCNQVVKTSTQNIIKFQALQEKNFLSWCKGVLFIISPIEQDDLKLQSEGKLYLESFVYAENKEYAATMKFNGFEIDVLDYTGYDTIEKLIECIIENKYDA